MFPNQYFASVFFVPRFWERPFSVTIVGNAVVIRTGKPIRGAA